MIPGYALPMDSHTQPCLIQVHLSQSGFASHLVKDNNIHLRNVMPDATPYRLGLPIEVYPESDEDKKCPTLIERKRKFQSIDGSIGCLAQSTRPDLAPSHSFLSAYINKPSRCHLNAALYILHYASFGGVVRGCPKELRSRVRTLRLVGLV
jgi:hypothetical protein